MSISYEKIFVEQLFKILFVNLSKLFASLRSIKHKKFKSLLYSLNTLSGARV